MERLEQAEALRLRRARGLSDGQIKTLFIMPTVLFLIAMNIFPLFWSLYLSFTRYSAIANRPPLWLGAENYRDIFTDLDIWASFTITGRFVVLSVLAQLLIGFGLAMLMNRKYRGQGLVTTLLLIPMMLSPVVVGLFWKFLLDSNWGLVNYFIYRLLPITKLEWFTNPQMALYSLVLVDTWMWAPFMMLLALAGLQAVPQYLYEAAEIDRASAWFKFRRITLPLVWPLLLVALIFRTMEAFKLFDLAYSLTAGGPGTSTELVAFRLYRLAFLTFHTGRAAALAFVVLVIIIGITNVYVKFLNRARGET